MSGKRPDRLGPLMPPGLRFLWGMALIVLTVFQHSLWILGTLLLVYLALVLWAGKRVKFFYFLFMILSIAFFHLLLPFGTVLFTIGDFPITLGALTEGLSRGVTIVALVFISLFSVSSKLRLPGRLGGLVARVFYYFEKLWDVKKGLSPKDFVGSTDKMLNHIFPPEGLMDAPDIVEPTQTQWHIAPGGVGLLILTLILPILGLFYL